MSIGGLIRFSEILKTTSSHPEIKNGCLLDTSILFAASYPPDRFNRESEELFEYLSELQIPLLTNINVRSEFMNKQRQVMIPEPVNLYLLYTEKGLSLSFMQNCKVRTPVFLNLESREDPINSMKIKSNHGSGFCATEN